MKKLLKEAPSWRSKSKGNDTPAFFHFVRACVYSEITEVIDFVEKYGFIGLYAKVRKKTEDDIRDRYLSDVGLDIDGGKAYDLGNQHVIARLQPNLSYLIELENGKTMKTLPKKGSDEKLYKIASDDFSFLKKRSKQIIKSRADHLSNVFLKKQSRSANEWKDVYINNPLLRRVAELLVWKQGNSTFILRGKEPIDVYGNPYNITNQPIILMHPMEETVTITSAWQKYFISNGLKQPFAQLWEPVIDYTSLETNRYDDCKIPYYRFLNQEKLGIHINNDYGVYIEIDGYDTDIEQIIFRRFGLRIDDPFVIHKISVPEKWTRASNHLFAYLDRITVYERVAKDDVSVMTFIDSFSLAQVIEFIKIAQDNNSINVLTLLIDHKNTKYSEYNPMDEFTLDLL